MSRYNIGAAAGGVWQAVWSQWWLVALAWYTCAVFTIAALKHASNNSMALAITVFANLVIGWPLVAPLAAFSGFRQLRQHWRKVLFIAVLSGLEKNLTNSSLYHIGASMKTALHGFNVVLTFFAAAFLGVDAPSRWCITGCNCRGNVLLALSITLVLAGGVVTASCSDDQNWDVSWPGLLLQLASSTAYALKFTVMKMLLGNPVALRSIYDDSSLQPPNKFQIAFVANPVTGLVGLCFLPAFDKGWALPEDFLPVAAAVAVSVTGILILQLRLTELTTPLTVAVLGVVKDVVAVLYMTHLSGHEDERFSSWQAAGYAVSMFGVVLYACARRRQPGGMARVPSTSSIGSSVEQAFAHGSPGPGR